MNTFCSYQFSESIYNKFKSKSIHIGSGITLSILLSACGGGSGGNSSVSTPPPQINNAPSATAASYNLLQDSDAISITLMASDPDGDALTYTIETQPSAGTAMLDGNVVSYKPDTEFSGQDSFSFSASDGSLSSNTATIDLTIDPASTFEGRVKKPNGDNIPNVTILGLDGSGSEVTTVTSDENGIFTLKSVTGQNLVLKISSEGHTDQIVPVTMPSIKSVKIPLDVVMLERGDVQTFDAGSNSSLVSTDGASVKVEPNSFVDANGTVVTGDVSVTMTSVDVSDATILAAFPGEFIGVEESNNTETAIVSLGTVEFAFTQNGEALQLDDGATAEIELPIYVTTNPRTGEIIELGDSIELWSLNEETGIWQQEGFGTVVVNQNSPTGFALRANVSHFSWWNCDISIDRATVDVSAVGTSETGVAVIHGRTENFGGIRTGNVNVSVGETVSGLIIPANANTCFWIEYFDTNNASGFTPEQCIENAIKDAVYPLEFDFSSEGPVILASLEKASKDYFVERQISIPVFPLTLETDVDYTLSDGFLPAGLTLKQDSSTKAIITGIPTETGDYNVTITATDSDNFTDGKNLIFSILDLPPPSLTNPARIYAEPGTNIEQAITVQITDANPPTSWIITDENGSEAPGNVTVSNAGVVTITNFDGIDASYLVTAYNDNGASNSVALSVSDIKNQPPILQSNYEIYFICCEPYTEDISSTVIGGNPATSWSVTNINGTPATAATITNAGVITITNPTTSTYNVIAFSEFGIPSEPMRLDLYETFDDPCLIDPLSC